ncbi:Uma2 family endonuclease [Streptosporangium sp. NPDC048047]|uniref:Uma2 family endonuclease n=1 Tax=Streptosporangium sp. NPDC048047 TaxID=3155748 RepID=UPI0034346B4E
MSIAPPHAAETPDAGLPETEPLPSWVIPPAGGFTADDLDRLRGIPPHTELIDGTLVFVSPQTRFHAVMIFALQKELDQAAPDHLRVEREMTLKLGERQRPEPDIVVLHAHAASDMMRTFYEASDVLLAVEVVSAESAERDRNRKPQLYAEAGISHFWRVEYEDGQPTVHVHQLNPATRAYTLTGSHRDRLKLSLPFEIDIDIAAIVKR